MLQYRDRLKETEKTIFNQIESEYSGVLKQKDEQISKLEDDISKMRVLVLELKARIQNEQNSIAVEKERNLREIQKQANSDRMEFEKINKEKAIKELNKMKEIL